MDTMRYAFNIAIFYTMRSIVPALLDGVIYNMLQPYGNTEMCIFLFIYLL